MIDKPDTLPDNRLLTLEVLIPLLAFGSSLAGIALWELAGMRFEIQFAAAGGFCASCILAYLAWHRPRKDIVSLTTPLYGFVFLATPIDYYQGILLQLFYAAGLTVLVLRLHYRFGTGADTGNRHQDLAPGPLRTYVESTRDLFAEPDPVLGRTAARAFLYFAEGEYRKAAEESHAGACQDGAPVPVIRAFGILRQHAELLDKNLPRPVTFQKFQPDDAALMAKPVPPDKPDREFEALMDNALLLLYSAAWHASATDRPSLVSSQPFANKLLES
jgi:hypothetical protein